MKHIENVKVEVQKSKNGLDYSVLVFRPGIAPQIFVNRTVIDCLIACGCSVEQIRNHERIDED